MRVDYRCRVTGRYVTLPCWGGGGGGGVLRSKVSRAHLVERMASFISSSLTSVMTEPSWLAPGKYSDFVLATIDELKLEDQKMSPRTDSRIV